MRVVEYIYFHFYDLISRYKKYNAREAAVNYLTWIIFFLSFPLIGWIVFKLGGKEHFLAFIISFLLYGLFIHYLNLKIIQRKIFLKELLRKYSHQNNFKKIIGYIVVISLLIFSPLIGFFILSFV